MGCEGGIAAEPKHRPAQLPGLNGRSQVPNHLRFPLTDWLPSFVLCLRRWNRKADTPGFVGQFLTLVGSKCPEPIRDLV